MRLRVTHRDGGEDRDGREIVDSSTMKPDSDARLAASLLEGVGRFGRESITIRWESGAETTYTKVPPRREVSRKTVITYDDGTTEEVQS